jgi:hypothetical protein
VITNLAGISSKLADAASSDPRIAAGMVAAGFVIGIAEYLRRKRKARKDSKNEASIDKGTIEK